LGGGFGLLRRAASSAIKASPAIGFVLALAVTGCASVVPSAVSGPSVQITSAQGPTQARLPCNRGASPHCDLRIYQVMVGSFVDGSSDHTPSGGYGPGPHTGDIAGVTLALDHIKGLGFNALWLTPIFDSAAGAPQSRPSGESTINPRLDGTGYFARDFFKVDPQFGDEAALARLISEARARGMQVILDGVFGHHKGAVTPSPSGLVPVDATDAKSYFGNPQSYPGRVVDYSHPASAAFFKEVARYWIDRFGIDGWRLDQVYQVPNGPLASINAEVQAAARAKGVSGYMVGEMWGSAEEIRAVLGSNQAPGIMSAFDFPARYALVQSIAGDERGNKGKPASTLNESWALGAHASYPDHAIMNFMLGNHDLLRFGDLIERAGLGGPDTQGYWDRHRVAFTFMAAWSGPITLYYGEEVGAEVPGFAASLGNQCYEKQLCDDHAGRNMVKLPGVNAAKDAVSPQALALKSDLARLMAIRSTTPALFSGARTHLYSDQTLYLDLKTLGAERIILAMNIGSEARTLALHAGAVGDRAITEAKVLFGPGVARPEAGSGQSQLSLMLPPLSATLIKLDPAQ
jgi:cyclomaltodextrinase / maltogenic alpha-amylase / neopullulanase